MSQSCERKATPRGELIVDAIHQADSKQSTAPIGRLGRLALFTARHRKAVIALWVVLTLIGGVAAGKLSSRWYQSFSIPGRSAYEASQRTLKAFDIGVRPPNVVVFHTNGDATKSPAIKAAMARAAATMPGALTSSYYSTHNSMYVSSDRHTTFLEVYPPGKAKFDTKSHAKEMQAAAADGLPPGIQVAITGQRWRVLNLARRASRPLSIISDPPSLRAFPFQTRAGV